MRQLIHIPLLFTIAVAMLIPEDTEMLEGFAPSDTLSELLPEDDYFEARSLGEGSLFKAIRNKRNQNYEILESPGLTSHFRANNVSPFKRIFVEKLNAGQQQQQQRSTDSSESNSSEEIPLSSEAIRPVQIRKPRSVENDTTESISSKSNSSTEDLPTAQKQVLKNNSELKSASLISRWTHSPFEFSKIHQDEEDSLADSSSINEGIRARTPRVSFVTQQKKNNYEDSKEAASKPEYYKSPPLIHNSKESAEQVPERDSPRPSYPEYNYRDREMEKFMNNYDSRYDPLYPGPVDSMPEYRRFHDLYGAYMPRTPAYPDLYYDYPDSRYDTPNPRDFPPPVYTNDIDDRYYMRSDVLPPSRRRIIYYAHLPEVVRTPPSVDLRYRSYDRYDPYYDPYSPALMGAYRKPRLERQMVYRDYGMPPTNRRLLEVKGMKDRKNDKKVEPLDKEARNERKDHLPMTREYPYRPRGPYY